MSLEILELLFIFFVEFTLLLFSEHELLHPCELTFLQVLDLLVQAEIVDIGADGLSRSGTKPDHLESSAVDLVRKLIYSDVGGGADEHFAHLLARQMIDECR